MKYKCVNCGKEDVVIMDNVTILWCSMDCKKKFYIDNYYGSALVDMINHEMGEIRK